VRVFPGRSSRSERSCVLRLSHGQSLPHSAPRGEKKNLHRLTDRFVRRCEVQRFDATSDDFRDGMVDAVRKVWKLESGTDLDTIPQDLGEFELGSDGMTSNHQRPRQERLQKSRRRYVHRPVAAGFRRAADSV